MAREHRIRSPKNRVSATQSIYRKKNAEGGEKGIQNNLTENGVKPLPSWFILECKRPGVQHGVYKKLRLGKYRIDAILDLHQMRVQQAREQVFTFIQEAVDLNLRTVSILHGKGQLNNKSGEGSLLKGYVNHWLRQINSILAFHSAQPIHGGTGATYVLLKKSSEKKRENWLRYNKGRLDY